MRDLRDYCIGVVILGLVVAAFLTLVQVASASTASRDAVLGGTDAFISEQLRVPIADRGDASGDAGQLGSGEGFVACADPSMARYGPLVLDSLTDRADLFFEQAWATVLHEHLHMLGGPCVYTPAVALDPTWSYFEEGFTEAVRLDLFPAFYWRMFHLRPYGGENFYPARVREVRALSVAGTGSSSYRDRAAVLWRRAALLADWPNRQVMIAAARAR